MKALPYTYPAIVGSEYQESNKNLFCPKPGGDKKLGRGMQIGL
jgi:hypothetical protein